MRLAAAGDIACDPASSAFNGGAGTSTECHQVGVSNAILAGGYDAVLALGDAQYNSGTASQFADSYQPELGPLPGPSATPRSAITSTAAPTRAPYFAYFGAAAGPAGLLLLRPRLLAHDRAERHLHQVRRLHAGSDQEHGCAPTSRRTRGLHPRRLAQPRSRRVSTATTMSRSAVLGDALRRRRGRRLTGHDHDYERFAPQISQGVSTHARGMREFVVGTGGENHTTFKAAIKPTSEVRDANTFGFLDLTLSDGAYRGSSCSDPPGGFTDSGSGTCH